jgi:adenylate kinase family enzyme
VAHPLADDRDPFRLDVYRAQTLPVLEWYKRNGTKVREIDAVGSVDDVTRRALAALN